MSLKIIQGEDRTLTVSLKDENGAAFDLSDWTAEASFCDNAGSTFQVAGSILSAVGGKVAFTLTDAQTVILDTGTQGFTVTLTKTAAPIGDLRKINLANSILVEAPIC